MSRLQALIAPFFALALLAGPAPRAGAQDVARVRIQVTGDDGRPSDATVALTPREGGAPRTCQTHGGRCEIPAVPRGRYVVTATPAASASGRPPLPRVVWVPPRVSVLDVRIRLR